MSLAPGIAAFLAVADARSFVRAGKALGLTQSGVSRAIARLEDRVQIRLFQRTARAVVLTEEGRRFHERVAPLMAELDEAANEASSATEADRDALHRDIGAKLPVGRTGHPDEVAETYLYLLKTATAPVRP